MYRHQHGCRAYNHRSWFRYWYRLSQYGNVGQVSHWALSVTRSVAFLVAAQISCYSPSSTSQDANLAVDATPDADLRITWPVRYVPAESAMMLGTATVVIAFSDGGVWNLNTGLVSSATRSGGPPVTTPIAVSVPQLGGPNLQVVTLRSLRISGGMITVQAMGPAIIIAQDITIDADAGLSVNAGPLVAGANTGDAVGGSIVSQGGGGGGFLSSGGGAGASGGMAYTVATILRGGSQGGRDPQCVNGSTSLGGKGGGAILLYAAKKITLLGQLTANGAGGIAGAQCTQGLIGEGGGGGGSGGAIVLQSPILEFSDLTAKSAGRLYATGGGGGGGGPGTTGLPELPGSNGGAGTRIGGTGGAGGIYAGTGGNGGASVAGVGSGVAGVMYPSGNMGYGGRGGGGGAAGYIELRTRSTTAPMEAAPPVARIIDGP